MSCDRAFIVRFVRTAIVITLCLVTMVGFCDHVASLTTMVRLRKVRSDLIARSARQRTSTESRPVRRKPSKRGLGFGVEDTKSPSCVSLGESLHKGKILLSKRSLDKGEVVFSDRPIWQVPLKAGGESLESDEQDVLDSFYALTASVRRQVLELYSKPGERCMLRLTFGDSGERLEEHVQLPPGGSLEEAWHVLRIFESNAVTIEARDFSSVFPLLSRMSHSCSPNIEIQFGERCEVRTLQPIKEGDELTNSYLAASDLVAPRKQRQARLSGEWDFLCCCPRCLVEEQQEEENISRPSEVENRPRMALDN